MKKDISLGKITARLVVQWRDTIYNDRWMQTIRVSPISDSFFRNDQDDVKQGDDVRCLYTSAPVPFATQRERETEREREKETSQLHFSRFSSLNVQGEKERKRDAHTHRQTYRQKENISSPCSR